MLIDEEGGSEIDHEPGREHLDLLGRNELTHATVVMLEAFARSAATGSTRPRTT